MFYVLFRYLKGDKEKDYQGFRLKEELIKFVEEKKNEIEINKIFEAKREFKFNWVLQLNEISQPIHRGQGRPEEENDEEKFESTEKPEESPNRVPIVQEKEKAKKDTERVDATIETTRKKRGRPKKAHTGTCKRPDCGEQFELEDWQHPALHWCPRCRNLPDYQDYDKGIIG